MNIQHLGKGAYPDRYDERDYEYEQIMGALVIDWQKGYDVEKELGHKFKIENQGASSSCVAQAWSKFTEYLEFKENKKFTDLSARDIYSQIYLPNGGAYIRDGAKVVVKRGNQLELDMPSYYVIKLDRGERYEPMKEEDMRKRDDTTPEKEARGLKFQAMEYRVIKSRTIDAFAHAIMNYGGVVTGSYGDSQGWTGPVVRPPKSKDWAHAVFCKGFGIKDGKKVIKFQNSWGNGWGESGDGYYTEDWFDPNETFIFNPWVIIDKRNMFKYVIQGKEQYIIGEDGKAVHIYNVDALKALRAMGAIKGEPQPVSEIEDSGLDVVVLERE